MKKTRIGKLKPRYSFILNQYKDFRASKCTKCEKPTFLRKFALLLHIDGYGLLVFGKTCRYCSKCELIIAHQDELEDELAYLFEKRQPEIIGNDYFVIGTVDKKYWKKGLEGKPATISEILNHTADFKKYLDLTIEPGGWYFAGKE